MLLDFVNGKSESLTVWLYNGGAETLKSYCGREISDDLLNSSAKKLQIREKFIKALPKKHLHFFNGLQFSYTWKDYFFVHAGIDPSRPLSKQRKTDMIWTRTPKFLASNQPFEKIIVHGHTPSKNVEKKINRINLDTGAVYSEYGKLSCMFIDAKENRKEFFASERGFL
jgi:serine/threonine protein phosphatase 1